MTRLVVGARSRMWLLYLTGFLVALGPYVLLPVGPVWGVYFLILTWSGAFLIVGRLLRDRPRGAAALWLLAACVVADATGASVLILLQPASPGPQDALFLSGNAMGILGTVWLLRRRLPGRDREGMLDASVIGCGFALLSWVYSVKPVVAGAGASWGTIVLFSYPLLDLFVFALLIRLLLSGGLRDGAMRLIASAQLAILVSDSAFAFLPSALAQSEVAFRAGTACAALMYGLFGTAALHPAFTGLTVESSDVRPGSPWMRTPLLLGAVMVAPALLVSQAWMYHSKVPDATAIAVGCVVIFMLVVARLQTLVARVNSQSVRLGEQAEMLRVLASRDGLTGLMNRRAWDAAVVAGLQNAQLAESEVSVAIIDVDHFKRYNDTHGHQAGDRLLKSAAAAWSGQLRQTDVLARYGGEEFIALLPGCTGASAAETVERLRAVTPDGQTFSAGIACWDRRETAEHLAARADAALYQAKNAGRDRSVLAPLPDPQRPLSADDDSAADGATEPVAR